MDRGEDARARELSNLRLALATFALHLDAFEMQADDAVVAAAESQGKCRGRHRGMGDWASIKSHGSKSGT